MASSNRTILHLDMDAFYASVEQRDRPELRGKPVIVGGDGRRGVVSTASYEARIFGVKSAMPGYRARELCPDGIFVAPRMSRYAEVSAALMAILARYSPLVEPLSLDEAFVDLSGSERLLGSPEAVGARIRAEVRGELQLTASVGVATSKFVAKVASDVNKPDGLTIVPPGSEPSFLAPFSVERLWGVGPKTAERVRAAGFSTIGDVAREPERARSILGELGDHLVTLATGRDSREVVGDHERKSIGAERTLMHDVSGRDAVMRQLRPLCDEVAQSLRAADLRAGGVRLKLKYADFVSVTRDCHLAAPAADSATLHDALGDLIVRAEVDRPIRLVGLAAFDLHPAARPAQLGLFAAPGERHERLERAMDAVAGRFGSNTLRRGAGAAGGGADGTGGVLPQGRRR
jgi:DNA polymerase-4